MNLNFVIIKILVRCIRQFRMILDYSLLHCWDMHRLALLSVYSTSHILQQVIRKNALLFLGKLQTYVDLE